MLLKHSSSYAVSIYDSKVATAYLQAKSFTGS